jgi:3-oxoadipate enol-lactonase
MRTEDAVDLLDHCGFDKVHYCGSCAAIRDMDQRETIGAITTPTLVIVGADDESTPVSAAEFIQSKIAGAELVVLESAAHVANIEQDQAFSAALGDFLSRHAN